MATDINNDNVPVDDAEDEYKEDDKDGAKDLSLLTIRVTHYFFKRRLTSNALKPQLITRSNELRVRKR